MSTLKLLVPIVAITVQSNSASTIIPPFLHDLRIPMAAIGSLISLGPILALASRLPVGMAYQRNRARLLISIAVLAMGITNYFYSFAQDVLVFAIVHALNGFAYGAVTTLYMAFYVDSLAPDENRNHAMGYYVGTLALGYSTGNFFGGLMADHLGYGPTFQAAALLSLVPVALLWFLHGPDGQRSGRGKEKPKAKLTVAGFVQGPGRTGVGHRGYRRVVSQLAAPDERSFYFALRPCRGYDSDADRRGARRLRRLQCRDPSDQWPCGEQVWPSRSVLCRHSPSIGNLDAYPALHRVRYDPRGLCFVGINARHRHRGQCRRIGAGRG